MIWQERRILHELGLLGPPGKVKILTNTPYVNNLLWQVKHAVKITPLVTDGSIPDTQEDFRGGHLSPSGVYTFFTEENSLGTLAPTFETITELPETEMKPYEISRFDYKPFYYNYREDS